MYKRLVAITLLVVIWLLSIGACRREIPNNNTVDTSEMELMYTTAYCLHGITASGGQTRPGIAACNTHLGDVALIYSEDGEYLGMYEVTDTGATDGLKAGKVIDVWCDDYEACVSWMELTNGKVYVKWIEGEG